jgi:replicative DNA helicase
MKNLANVEYMERAVVGAIVEKGGLIYECPLAPSDFDTPRYAHLYETLQEMGKQNKAIDALTVLQHLVSSGTDRKSASEMISGIFDESKLRTEDNFREYVKTIEDASTFRKVQTELSKGMVITSSNYKTEAKDIAERTLETLEKLADNQTMRSASQIVKSTMSRIKNKKKGELTGIATGFSDFDLLTDGWKPSELIVLGGRPGMGKTALAIKFAISAVRDQTKKPRVFIYSQEMDGEDLMMRILSAESGIDMARIQNLGFDGLYDWEQELLEQSAELVEEMGERLMVDDAPGATVSKVRANLRKSIREYPNTPHLIIIDYLHLMDAQVGEKNLRRDLEIGKISWGLKSITRMFKTPVIALSQLSRESEKGDNKKPENRHLRDSGSIEQDADKICFAYREEVYDEETEKKDRMEIILSKHRNGKVGTSEVKFFKETQRFEDIIRCPKCRSENVEIKVYNGKTPAEDKKQLECGSCQSKFKWVR